MPTGTLQSSEAILNQFSSIFDLISAVGFLFGVVTFVFGLYGFYKKEENPNKFSAKKSFNYLFSGSLLLTSSSIYQVVSNTFTGANTTPSRNSLSFDDLTRVNEQAIGAYQYQSYLPMEMWSLIMGFLFVVGLYSFTKGLFIIRLVGETNDDGQPISGKKVFNHIIFGMACMNCPFLIDVFGNSFFRG